MAFIQLVGGVKIVVPQRISVSDVKIDINLKESYRNGLKVNASDYTERLNDAPGKA